jgi:hypothetical protein
MKNRQYSQDVTLVSRRVRTPKGKLLSLPSCLIALTLCGVLTMAAFGGYYLLSPGGRAGPLVLIHIPQNGGHLIAGQPITVQAVAADPRKVVRVELWVDGQLLKSETSNVSGGIASFPLLADWQPASAGAHIILVRAFNALGVRAHSSIKIDVVSDRDGDGTADDADLCPDQSGLDIAKGCPDRDADGTPDSADTCPDVAGVPEAAGCAAATEGDRDGDGSPDATDACADVAGSALLDGCPDADGDLVADAEDTCPAEPGPAGSSGCPAPAGDADSDGVPDGSDVCPSEWGVPEHGGCPEVLVSSDDGFVAGSGTRDSDGDGASDDVDPCPAEAGSRENGFCPPPGEDPADSGDDLGLPDLMPEGEGVSVLVEFEALHFEVSQEYEEVWCYARLADEDMERYDFAPGDERQWEIAEVLGGENSVYLGLSEGEQMGVFVDCWGSVDPAEPPHHLGSTDNQHGFEAWGGEVISMDSGGGEGGHSFHVRYHLCSPSCDETALQPPVITSYAAETDRIHLDWAWEGDSSTISGFKLYLNGNFIQAFPRNHSDVTWLPPEGMPCVDRWEFYLTAFSGSDADDADLESSPGNTVVWEGMPCQEQIRVTFESLDLYAPIVDEGGGLQVGPVTGDFLIWSSGYIRGLFFDAAHCMTIHPLPGETCFGLRLHPGTNSIQGILDEVNSSSGSCEAVTCPYRASVSDTVTLPAERGSDLMIAGRIVDVDPDNPDDIIFDGHITVDIDSLSPDSTLRLTIPGPRTNVVVLIDLYPFDP